MFSQFSMQKKKGNSSLLKNFNFFGRVYSGWKTKQTDDASIYYRSNYIIRTFLTLLQIWLAQKSYCEVNIVRNSMYFNVITQHV